ncbi:unnamed protein product [Prunus armeniaca]|uniref:Uncharacterized protein n=1 Tax=Prunus armeniaca TaxID=36596 RepID=A0A6J5UNV1_PRUAR|nr:unnamed protein product [Prunus armeniaca]
MEDWLLILLQDLGKGYSDSTMIFLNTDLGICAFSCRYSLLSHLWQVKCGDRLLNKDIRLLVGGLEILCSNKGQVQILGLQGHRFYKQRNYRILEKNSSMSKAITMLV